MQCKQKIFLIILVLLLSGVCAIPPVTAAATTQLHIVKYANDGSTVINETTVNFTWMMANLPVYGDGTTHYYHQGPVVNASIPNLWNPEENDPAILTKDMGAVMGSDLKDLCNLVGGMSASDFNVTLLASDGFSKRFAYSSIYTPTARAGPIVITWYKDGLYVNGPVGANYTTGMRNVNFADTSTNPWGLHVFGLYDMNVSYPEPFWYYYQPGQPSTTGLSVQIIDRVFIYSNQSPPVQSPDWSINLTGARSVTVTKAQFESIVAGGQAASYTDVNGGIWSGIPLWYLVGAVDENDAGAWTFNSTLAATNYTVKVLAGDGYSKNFTSFEIDHSSNYIVANTLNGTPLSSTDPSNPSKLWWPVKLIGSSATGGKSVGNITTIQLYGLPQAPVATPDWTIGLSGARNITVTKAQFESIVAGGQNASYTDANGGVWNGIQLWYLVGAVDENDAGAWTYNSTLAAMNYTVRVLASDGYSKNFTSFEIDHSSNYIVANTLNGTPLSSTDPSNPSKLWWPVKLIGSSATGGKSVGNITAIQLFGLPQAPGPVVDTIFDGTVTLTPGETFTKQAYNNVTGGLYTINRTTPLGALDKVATLQGFAYNVTDKRWSYDQVLLLDDLGQYLYKKPNVWYAYVNDVYKDGYGNHDNGLNVIELSTNDQVNFYYAPNKDPNPVINATEVVKIKVNISGSATPDWILALNGARNTTVSKTYFEQGLACPVSGHLTNWTDANGTVWSGVPLWLLVGMIDDNPDIGPDHFNFNDSLAAQGYSVNVYSGDGWSTTLSSRDIARNNSYFVTNMMNGSALPYLTPGGKPSWPLHLKGAAVFGGQQVGNITRIELSGLPQPPTEWTLTLEGDVTDTITQSYFEGAIACHHNVTYTDSSSRVWGGVPLWDLAGAVDDIETTSHFTFNDTRAAMNYTIRVSAGDGFNATFISSVAAHNDGFIVANTLNGTPLSGSNGHLKLVGPATTSGSQRVGNITKISLEGLPSFPAGDWQIRLVGKISDLIPQSEFEYWVSCHSSSYTDANGNVYTGIPLWRLMGWVDDRIPHGPNGFNDAAALAGYKVIVKAGDGYAKEFTSTQIGKNDNFIVANRMNGSALSTDGAHPPYPLRLVGSGATGGNSVGNIIEIQLTDFQTPVTAPSLHILKYGTDGITVINETTVTYAWMEQNLPVIGDGITSYKFEGLTMNASNLWDPEETYPGGYKISDVVKGTKVHDIAELVGGMGSGTTITFVAGDGFETTLPYSSIYTNPEVQARQGDAIIAWWGDGQYVPTYQDGMRLFFTPGGDHVFGQWDMHETLPSQYWRYNFQDGIQYPSAAGLSAKYITTMKVYSSPESDWILTLDGRDIDGLYYNVSKPYFEEALACQFGANHGVNYTDSQGRIWTGMPLWFLAGFVDDADQHSANSYNDTKALAGYNITVTGIDGYSYTFDSRSTIRSSNYIVANTLNGTHINNTDSSWPLRLVGQNVSGSKDVKKITSITLKKFLEPTAGPTLILPSANQPSGFESNVTVMLRDITKATGIGFNVTYDPAVMHITDIRLNSTIDGATLYMNISNSTGKASIGITSLDNITFTYATGIVDLTIRTVGTRGSSTALSTSNAEWTDAIWGSNNLIVIPGSVNITIRGDFNQNGRVDIGDVTKVAYMAAGLVPRDPFADFNGDTAINVADASKIAWHYVGKIAAL